MLFTFFRFRGGDDALNLKGNMKHSGKRIMVAHALLIARPVNHNPASGFPAFGIMMRPVNHAATVIPLIATAQRHGQPLPHRYALREVDIMGDQDAVTVSEFKNKALVT
jgi:hypothetical protein